MCGISVIISPGKTIDKLLLNRMNEVIAHRGPDGEGYYIDNNDGVGLGHRRLSIIDLSEGGAQPMNWQDKYVISYNGEVYNYIEIRNELVDMGYSFSSKSDTEVILAAYDNWGVECFSKFNGMWAICLYDKTRGKVILSRDRFGVKPLYYFQQGNDIYASSEIKQLLATNLVKRKPNYEVLMNFLILSLVEQDNQTFYESVFSIPPSHFLTYDLKEKEFRLEQYYFLKINPETRKLSEDESIAGYHSLIQDSIKLRLRSDVKVGTCLSGGLDSSYIASVASAENMNLTDTPFIGITASSIDPRNDEVHFAKMVAEAAHLDWNIIRPDKTDFDSKLHEVVFCQEEPFTSPSIFMQYFVMSKAAELNCKVLLDGQGGDETLLGYERYYISFLNGLSLIKKFKAFTMIRKNSKLSFWQIILYYLYFNKIFIRKIVAKRRHSNIRTEYYNKVNWMHLKHLTSAFKNIDTNQYFEITKGCLPHLLKYEDRNSMRHSIETRLPFIDYRCVEFAHSIRPDIKIKEGWTKYVLRSGASKILPDEIRWRKIKFGFESPDKVWLKDKSQILETVASSPLIKHIIKKPFKDPENLEILWRYYSVALWEKQFQIEV